MLCILSGSHPFFRSPDDCTALAEITSVFGSTKMQQCASKLGTLGFILFIRSFIHTLLILQVFVYFTQARNLRLVKTYRESILDCFAKNYKRGIAFDGMREPTPVAIVLPRYTVFRYFY